METKVGAIVLAGGKGTRMRSRKSKLVHKILGKEIIKFPVEACREMGADPVVVVVGPHNHGDIKRVLDRDVKYAIQREALGTAHAVWQAEQHFKDFKGEVLILVGDSPYISKEILENLINFHRKNQADITIISSVFETPPAYGRLIKDERGWVKRVVEEIDATEEEKKIKEVNSSYYCISWERVFPLLHEIKINEKKGEYYLTDIVEIAYNHGLKTIAFRLDQPLLTKGINTRADLSEAATYFSRRKMEELEQKGVTFFGKETITVEFNVRINRDTIIYPCTYLGEGTEIGKGCEIGPFVLLRNIRIPEGTRLSYAKMEGVEDEE